MNPEDIAGGALEQRATVLETVLHCMSAAVVAFDGNGRFLLANPAARAFAIGLDPDVTLANWPERLEVTGPDGRTPGTAADYPHLRAIAGWSVDADEFVVRAPATGASARVVVTTRPLTDARAAPLGGVAVFHDVTALKETQAELGRTAQELQVQARFMETVLHSISDGVIAADATGKHVFSNQVADRLFGEDHRNAHDSDRSGHYGLFLPDGETPFPAAGLPLGRAVRGETSDDVEMLLRNPHAPDGTTVRVSGRPLRDEAGVSQGGVVLFREVTRLKRAERELRRTAEQLRARSQMQETYFHSIPEGVVVVDAGGKPLMINALAERLGGVGTADAAPADWPPEHGIFFSDQVTPVPTDELPLTRALGGEATDGMELFLRNPSVPDGIFVSMNGRTLFDDDGALRGAVAVFRDVTARVRAEEALTQAFAEGRTEILDTILHNIGNAINSVVTGVSAIREEYARNEPLRRLRALAKAVEGHQQDWARYLETDPQGRKVIPFVSALAEEFGKQSAWMEKTMDRVEKRVGHIVDIVRTQRSVERSAMVEKDVVLREAIMRAVRLIGESLSKRGYRVAVDCDEAPYEIRIHESRFHQMMVNLIKNAMESLDDLRAAGGLTGKPAIRVRARGEGALLVVEVSDNGAGFKPKHARRLFQAGYTTKETGSGLGLHATANYAAVSGGSVEATSGGHGKGATIRVRLRVSPGAAGSAGEQPSA